MKGEVRDKASNKGKDRWGGGK